MVAASEKEKLHHQCILETTLHSATHHQKVPLQHAINNLQQLQPTQRN